MGLTSLSRLNRSGVYDYWEDSWFTEKTYKQHLFKTVVIKYLINEILSGFFFNILKKKNNTNLGFFQNQSVNFKSLFVLYFSKVWVLKYQNWVIILIYFFKLNYTQKFNNTLKINNFVKQKKLKNYKYIF